VELKNVSNNTYQSKIIAAVYRPPDTDVCSFNDILSELLGRIRHENKLMYLMGDFNINLLNCDSHVPSSEFLDVLHSNSFFPLITKPTRIQQDTASLIDHIFCNQPNHWGRPTRVIQITLDPMSTIFSLTSEVSQLFLQL
jgi:Txe/YoeB family toxin of Txe-Axe toxin-antitoxin module